MKKLNDLLNLYNKYKEAILYLVFGGLTTLLNIVVYAVLARGLRLDTMWATGIALVVSILFAYVTNKLFVFESRKSSFVAVLREFAEFIACRLFTGALDMLIMYVTVEQLGWYDILMKIVSNIIVIVLNFIFSKLFIFRKEK